MSVSVNINKKGPKNKNGFICNLYDVLGHSWRQGTERMLQHKAAQGSRSAATRERLVRGRGAGPQAPLT